MDWGWTIGTVLALIGLGYAAMSGSRPHPQAARFFFVTASIVAFCKIATWGASVAMNTTLRIGLVGLSGAAVAVLLAEAIRYTFPPSPEVSEARQERAPPLPAPANATPSALSSSPQFGPDAVLASPTLPEKSKLVAKALRKAMRSDDSR